MTIASCLYAGEVRHRRRAPRPHEFRARLCLMYVDLAELPGLFRRRWLWSADRPNLCWFRRADHSGPADRPLAECIRELIAVRTGATCDGPIRLLTGFRYAGFVMNPISLYYCFDRRESLEFVIAEVTNTPWGEQHCYVLDVRGSTGTGHSGRAAKTLHVSPFLGMDYDYEFRLSTPGDALTVHIENHESRSDHDSNAVLFDATLTLRRRPLSGGSLAWALARYPLLPAQVFAGIYWQALRLWLKRTPFFPHPRCAASVGHERYPAESFAERAAVPHASIKAP